LAEDHVVVIGANTYRVLSQIVAEEEDPGSPDGRNPGDRVLHDAGTAADVSKHAGGR
jgi:hypothetical protein